MQDGREKDVSYTKMLFKEEVIKYDPDLCFTLH